MENVQLESEQCFGQQQHEIQLENCSMIHSSSDPTRNAFTEALPRPDGIIDQQSECDEEDFTIVSMSPDEGNTFFPSRTSNALLPDLRHGNIPFASRENVLQKLCDALLRRSLTKVGLCFRVGMQQARTNVPYLVDF